MLHCNIQQSLFVPEHGGAANLNHDRGIMRPQLEWLVSGQFDDHEWDVQSLAKDLEIDAPATTSGRVKIGRNSPHIRMHQPSVSNVIAIFMMECWFMVGSSG